MTDLKKNLTPEENKILEVKYEGRCFGKMNDDERSFAAKTLLLKISAITGWVLPINEMIDILIDQFEKKLSEGYKNTTIAEIEYAFRNRGMDVKDWGKQINLSLMDEVMIPYLSERAELSKIEEHLKSKPMIEEKKQLTDSEWEEWIVDIKDYPFELIPIQCYDYLVRSGKINPTTKEKKECMNKAMPIYALSISENLRKWDEFIKQKNNNSISGEHFDSLVVISKRIIVQDYLNSIKNV